MATVEHAYPLDAPGTPGPVSSTLSRKFAVAISESPYTFQQQVQRFAGQAWKLSVSLPPMTRAQASEWKVFYSMLEGMYGTFRYRAPGGVFPRGSASGNPVVQGANQTGNQLATSGWTPSAAGVLLKGDYFQLGSGLHEVLADVNVDGSGQADVLFWPRLRAVPDDGASIITTSPKGIFRMDTNELQEALNEAHHYGFSFSAMEAQ